VDIERELWRSLLSIATGKDTAYKALEDFFRKVPWNDLDMIADADRDHFADGRFP
jgi:hypothetical protein